MRIVVAATALMFGIGALGCSSSSDGKSPPEPASRAGLVSCDVRRAGGEPVELTLWYAENDQFTVLLAGLVDEFTAAHPGVEVRMEDLGSRGRDAVLEAWRATAPANRPSLAVMAEDAARLLADSGQAVAPGDCLADVVPGLVPAVAEAWSVAGVVQAVPFAVSTPVLVYDRQAFRDAGLDPDRPPATLDELRGAAERIVAAGTAEVGLLFDAGPGGAAWLVEQWNAQSGALSVAPGNGWSTSAEEARWQNGPAVDHLAWLGAMVEDGLAAPVVTNSSGIDDLAALMGDRQRAAMTLHTSAAVAPLLARADAGELPGFELGVAPLPGPGPGRDPAAGADAGSSGSLPGGAALWIGAGKPPVETEAAWSLAAFLASPAVQARWAAQLGYSPITSDAATIEPLRSTWARWPEQAVGFQAVAAQGTSPVELGMSVGPEREVRQLLSEAVVTVAEGGDPAEALDRAASDADRLLRAYGRGAGNVDTVTGSALRRSRSMSSRR